MAYHSSVPLAAVMLRFLPRRVCLLLGLSQVAVLLIHGGHEALILLLNVPCLLIKLKLVQTWRAVASEELSEDVLLLSDGSLVLLHC